MEEFISCFIWQALDKVKESHQRRSLPACRGPEAELTLIHWQSGVTWDVSVTDTFADSYLATTLETAADGRHRRLVRTQCQELAVTHIFVSLAFETPGPMEAM